LYLLEEVAIVAEEALGAALGDQRLQDAGGDVGFADADGAGDEQAAAFGFEGEAVDEARARSSEASSERWAPENLVSKLSRVQCS
jgi:hypothetical protein